VVVVVVMVVVGVGVVVVSVVVEVVGEEEEDQDEEEEAGDEKSRTPGAKTTVATSSYAVILSLQFYLYTTLAGSDGHTHSSRKDQGKIPLGKLCRKYNI
jgi:hypothetical protein